MTKPVADVSEKNKWASYRGFDYFRNYKPEVRTIFKISSVKSEMHCAWCIESLAQAQLRNASGLTDNIRDMRKCFQEYVT